MLQRLFRETSGAFSRRTVSNVGKGPGTSDFSVGEMYGDMPAGRIGIELLHGLYIEDSPK